MGEGENRRNAGCGLNLEASAGLWDIPNGAWDRMYPKKDFPGLQRTPSRWGIPSFHERSLLGIADQPEMRGWIAGMNCIADFSQLLQKFALDSNLHSLPPLCDLPLAMQFARFFCNSSKANLARPRGAVIISNFDCRMAGPPLL